MHRLRNTFLRWFAEDYIAAYKLWSAEEYNHPLDNRPVTVPDWSQIFTSQYYYTSGT